MAAKRIIMLVRCIITKKEDSPALLGGLGTMTLRGVKVIAILEGSERFKHIIDFVDMEELGKLIAGMTETTSGITLCVER